MGMLGEIKDASGCPNSLTAGTAQPVELTVVIMKNRQILPFAYLINLYHIKPNGEQTMIGSTTGRLGFMTGGGTEATVKVSGTVTPNEGQNKFRIELKGSVIGLLNRQQDLAECIVEV